MRWVWIDKFVAFDRGKTATAVKNLSLAEDHYAQHFPGYPIMPAALMLEGLAQTGGILVGDANDFRENVVLAKIARAHFTREAMAGEQVRYRTDVLTVRPEGAVVQGSIHVGDELIGEAEITFAHADPAKIAQVVGEQKHFVFDGELKHMLAQARSLQPSGGS